MNEESMMLEVVEQILEGMWMDGGIMKSVLPTENGEYMWVSNDYAHKAKGGPYETYEQYLERMSNIN